MEKLSIDEEDNKGDRLGPEVGEAIQLLKQDVKERIHEIEGLLELQRPSTAKSASLSGTMLMNMNSSLQNISKVRPWETVRGGNSTGGLPIDPLLNKILNKLQSEMLAKLGEKINDKDFQKGQGIEAIINQNLMQFTKDLALYEQKKYKEFNGRLEKANSENKKLSTQIIKLRERWDSLVESAKQRRTRQQANLDAVSHQ